MVNRTKPAENRQPSDKPYEVPGHMKSMVKKLAETQFSALSVLVRINKQIVFKNGLKK